MSGDLIPINKHCLYVETHGSDNGLPVLLLHHGLGSVKAWKGQVRAFVGAGYRVIAYDRWGYGGSDPRDHLSMPYFEQDLSDLETLLDFFGLDQVALIGHSDGGTISLYYAAQNPARVACMVVTAAHIYVEPKMIPGIQGIQQAFINDVRMQVGLERLHGDKANAVFQGWYQGWTKPEYLDWNIRPLLSGITCPTLVVQGINDEHATPKHAEDIVSAIPGAKLWLEPGAAHMLPQDIPEEFNRKVISFLRTHYKL
jgi:pimeloyl-ACP methyl ester carboxylesterase